MSHVTLHHFFTTSAKQSRTRSVTSERSLVVGKVVYFFCGPVVDGAPIGIEDGFLVSKTLISSNCHWLVFGLTRLEAR